MATWIHGGIQAEPDDSVPYLERQARQTFTIALTAFLDGVEAALVRR
ncbi:hypothetical protein [Nonomuraea rhodomycinica]|uniref:Uncharacterized protein n=1 Tax=Nonomuraea rhodomycinica TaxID=1712872 RepID=A0A7Y6ING6_9ACTN|nr:hypothetical protein [Nonomuraea rhodomycinica]NUW41218.1 hypothetical protein [Nonomuraea rhodomycinica]